MKTKRVDEPNSLALKESAEMPAKFEQAKRDLKASRAEVRKLNKYLSGLTTSVRTVVRQMDIEMQKPSTHERGKQIAALMNALNLVNDQARYFGLGIDFRKDRPVRHEKKAAK